MFSVLEMDGGESSQLPLVVENTYLGVVVAGEDSLI